MTKETSQAQLPGHCLDTYEMRANVPGREISILEKGKPEGKDRNVGRKLTRVPCVRKTKKGGLGKQLGTNLVNDNKEAEKGDETLLIFQGAASELVHN